MQGLKSAIVVFLLRLAALLPLSLLHRMGRGLGGLLSRFSNKIRLVTRINLELCLPELSDDARETLMRESLRETGKTVFEAGLVWLRPADEVLGLIKGEKNIELLHDAVAENRGLIVISPHLGNWEILTLYLGHHYALSGLYRPSRLPGVDKLIYAARSRSDSIPIPANIAGVLKVRKALGKGGVTLLLPDQQPRLNSGLFAPFFGVPALSMRLVSTLAKKSGSKILCMYARRLPGAQGFEIVCREPDAEVYSDDLETSVAAVNRSMELCVRDCPAQYHWEYTRFSKQEDDTIHIYRDHIEKWVH
jgi:KDO2-lipid IV(A) lauroyltransferase